MKRGAKCEMGGGGLCQGHCPPGTSRPAAETGHPDTQEKHRNTARLWVVVWGSTKGRTPVPAGRGHGISVGPERLGLGEEEEGKLF